MFKLNKDITAAFEKLAESGKAVGDKPYIVGGFVRDWIYGLELEDVNDFDVISELGKTDEIIEDMAMRFGLGAPVEYGYTGTKKLIIEGYTFEFQSANNPHVHFPIEPDLEAMGIEVNYFNKNIYERDFTIDTLCYDVIEKKIVDLTGNGVEDLVDNHLLRTPIDPRKAIEYNPFIILRGFRLCLEFGLQPEEKYKQLIPYGVQLLPKAIEERSEKFAKGIIRDIFEYDFDKATELFAFYGLYNVLPVPKDILDKKVKNDMGIKFQAENLFSLEVNDAEKTIRVGFTTSDLNEPEKMEALQRAIADMYLHEAINEEYQLIMLGQEKGFCMVAELGAMIKKACTKDWYRIVVAQTNIHLYDRFQRREEYRNRKRREQKRDRIGKFKSWRDFRSKIGRG